MIHFHLYMITYFWVECPNNIAVAFFGKSDKTKE